MIAGYAEFCCEPAKKCLTTNDASFNLLKSIDMQYGINKLNQS
jgi:hypothetical protein